MSWLCRVKIELFAQRSTEDLLNFSHLLKGREQPTSELAPILARLSKHHAEAVKLRVKALNRTVRGRTRSRHQRKKPDIRDVFRDVEVRIWCQLRSTITSTCDVIIHPPPPAIVSLTISVLPTDLQHRFAITKRHTWLPWLAPWPGPMEQCYTDPQFRVDLRQQPACRHPSKAKPSSHAECTVAWFSGAVSGITHPLRHSLLHRRWHWTAQLPKIRNYSYSARSVRQRSIVHDWVRLVVTLTTFELLQHFFLSFGAAFVKATKYRRQLAVTTISTLIMKRHPTRRHRRLQARATRRRAATWWISTRPTQALRMESLTMRRSASKAWFEKPRSRLTDPSVRRSTKCAAT